MARRSSLRDECVREESGRQQSRIADLLECDSIKLQRRASCQDVWQLAHETEAEVERAEPE